MTQYVETTYAKIAQTYTDAFFDDIADLPFVDMLPAVLPKGAQVLDLGCGPGQFAKYLAHKGFRVEGIDTSDAMLAIAKEKVPNVPFKQMDMRKLEFADQTFDSVLAVYSIIHIPTPELPGVLAEIRRVLKPDGCALFIVQQGEADQILDEPLAKGEKIFMNFFSQERLYGLLAAAGFEIVRYGSRAEDNEDVLSSMVTGVLVTKT